MFKILIAGAGIIGKTVAHWLDACNDYEVHLADIHPIEATLSKSIHTTQLDTTDSASLKSYLEQHKIEAIVGTLPHGQLTSLITAIETSPLHYFDVTEDTSIAATLAQLGKQTKKAILPQCGLAPGYINIIANDLMQQFDQIESVKLRCGALPQNASNSLHYAFTWSVDGLVNEYINPCETLKNKVLTLVPALSEIEEIEIDGKRYEAFHTSGGLAGLATHYAGQISQMDYKTIRYPGHANKMNFLLKDLKLENNREQLIDLLTNAIPYTHDDVVVIYVSVNGYIKNKLTQKTFVKKYYPQVCFEQPCSALQLTTIAGLCSMLDIVLNNPNQYQGLVQHHQFDLQSLYQNRFGSYLALDHAHQE